MNSPRAGFERGSSQEDEYSRPQLFVTIQNLPHLAAAHGARFAAATLQVVRQRVLAAGITSTEPVPIGDDGFLVSPYPILLEDSAARTRLLEDLLLRVCARPIEQGGISAFAVLSLAVIHTRDGESPPTAEFGRLAILHQPVISPVQRTDAWGMAYAADMADAVRVFGLLDDGQLAFAFQPIVARVDWSQQLYQEALVRRLRGTEEPESICYSLKALERLGLMRYFDRCTVAKAVSILKTQPALCLGCNISAQSAVLDPWWHAVLEELSMHPDVAARLVIELTESTLLPGTDEAVGFVQRLHELGCRIAMDDFGAGFSTLEFIVRAKPDVIKIDHGYLMRGRSGTGARDVLTNLIRLCSRLASDVVVEGIESDIDVQTVRPRLNIWLQGYFMAHPKVLPSWHRQSPYLLENSGPSIGRGMDHGTDMHRLR